MRAELAKAGDIRPSTEIFARCMSAAWSGAVAQPFEREFLIYSFAALSRTFGADSGSAPCDICSSEFRTRVILPSASS